MNDYNLAPSSAEHPIMVQGREEMAWAIRFLLRQNDLSHSELASVWAWSNPDLKSWLSKSQLSSMRNSGLAKPGPQILRALGTINLRLAQLAGVRTAEVLALPPTGPLPPELKKLDGKAQYLKHPRTGQPLNSGDVFQVLSGELQLHTALGETDAKEISRQLAIWVQKWMLEQRLMVSELKKQVLAAYPVTADNRRERLWSVVLGDAVWDGEELEVELADIRALLGQLMGRDGEISEAEFEQWRQGRLASEA